MSYGIKVINPATGSIQIDENYKNMEVALSFSSVTVGNVSPVVWGDVNVFTAGNSRVSITYDSGPEGGPLYPPLLMVCTSHRAVQRTWEIAAVGPVGARRMLHYITWCINAPIGTTASFLIFTRPYTEDALSGYGLVVMDGAGEVTFNSSRYYANIAGVATGSNYASFSPVAFPAGRTYAAVAVGWSGRSQTSFIGVMPGGQFINYFYDEWCLMPWMDGNVLRADTVKICQAGIYDQISSWPGNQNYTVAPYTILVLDITHFPTIYP